MDTKDVVTKKPVLVTLITNTNLKIEGCIYVPSDIRILDDLNVTHKTFYAVTDARVLSVTNQEIATRDVIFVNKNQITLVFPIDAF